MTKKDNYIAIGDIHGRYDLLDLLLSKILSDGRFYDKDGVKADDHLMVFLGDMVDRGPQSFEVVERIKNLCEQGYAIALLGNHEDMMLDYARNGIPDRNNIWFYNGAKKTIDSYSKAMGTYGFGSFFKSFGQSGHREWMRSLPYFYETDKVWFSHAPIPSVEMLAEMPLFSHIRIRDGDWRANRDLLTWTYVPREIAQEGSWEHGHRKIAVCGHVHALQYEDFEPRFYPNIIYADTGCGCGPDGRLTAIIIEDGKLVDCIQAAPIELECPA